jgi:hypothetical protein
VQEKVIELFLSKLLVEPHSSSSSYRWSSDDAVIKIRFLCCIISQANEKLMAILVNDIRAGKLIAMYFISTPINDHSDKKSIEHPSDEKNYTSINYETPPLDISAPFMNQTALIVELVSTLMKKQSIHPLESHIKRFFHDLINEVTSSLQELSKPVGSCDMVATASMLMSIVINYLHTSYIISEFELWITTAIAGLGACCHHF